MFMVGCSRCATITYLLPVANAIGVRKSEAAWIQVNRHIIYRPDLLMGRDKKKYCKDDYEVHRKSAIHGKLPHCV